MSETTSTTTDESNEDAELPADDATKPAEAATAPDPEQAEDTPAKPKRSTGLRKPTGPARGAMAATAMAAVPASGLAGSVLYGNFGPMGVVAAGGVAAAAGGVALAVRAKRRAEERAKAKCDKATPPAHPLGGLKGLLAKSKERAAQQRQAIAERRAGKGGGLRGLVGAGGTGRRGGSAGGSAPGRMRSVLGAVTGRGRSAGAAAGAGRAAGGRGAGRPLAGGKAAAGGRAAGRHAAPGAGGGGRRQVGGGRAGSGGAGRGRSAAGGRGAGGAGRYMNPATGRPMTASQVSSAIRRQQRAQRIVSGNSYPQRVARWAARHPRAVGLAAAGVGGLAAAVMFAPLAAAAAVGLGAFGAARHPAFRNAAFIAGRGVGRHSARVGRWLRGQWLAWRRRKTPLEGDIVDDPPVTPPEPDIIDAEIVPEPEQPAGGQPALGTAPPAPAPTPEPQQEPFAPPNRQPRLITAGNTNSATSEEKTAMSHPFETANETLHDVSFTPESGAHAEAAVDAIPGVLSAAASSIRSVLASVAEHLPQGADSLEHLNGIADAVDGISSQADEQIAGWKQSANWVWQGQD